MTTKKTNCNEFITDAILEGKMSIRDLITSVSDEFGITRNAAQKRVAKVRNNLKDVHNSDSTDDVCVGKIIHEESAHNYDKDEHIFKGSIPLYGKFPVDKNGNPIDENYIFAQYHLDSSNWRIVSFKINYWESQVKGGSVIDLHQYTLVVAPKRSVDYTPEDVADILARKICKIAKNEDKRLNEILKSSMKLTKDFKNKKGYVVVIDLADVHIGLLAWWRETGEDFDIKIAKRQVMHAIDEIISKLNRFNIPITKIILVTLGDFLHVDNDMQTTTKGTHQQCDGRFGKMTDAAFDLLYDIITKLRLIAPVEYVYIQGNHDREHGRMLAFAVKQRFHNVDGVTFDVEPNPHKYRIIGNIAIGWTHGDMNKKNLDGLMNNMVRNQTDIDAMFLHVGHLHSASSYQTTDGRCTIEHIDSLCPASLWEHQQGYGETPKRYAKAFLFSGDAVPPEVIVGATE